MSDFDRTFQVLRICAALMCNELVDLSPASYVVYTREADDDISEYRKAMSFNALEAIA